MSDKQHISLVLDAHHVPLDVDRDREPLYRDAAKLLNHRYQFYQRRMPQASAEQLWVYVALEMGVNLQSDARDKNLEPIQKKIAELNNEIEQILNQDKHAD